MKRKYSRRDSEILGHINMMIPASGDCVDDIIEEDLCVDHEVLLQCNSLVLLQW